MNWSEESTLKAQGLLCSSLRYLYNYINTYTQLARENFIFTNEVSDIYRQLGRCQTLAEVTGDKEIIELIDHITDVSQELMCPIKFAAAFQELHDMLPSLEMSINQFTHDHKANISVDNYVEKT